MSFFITIPQDVAELVLQYCLGKPTEWKTVSQISKRFLQFCQLPGSQSSIQVKTVSARNIHHVCTKLTGLRQLVINVQLLRDEHIQSLSRLTRLIRLSVRRPTPVTVLRLLPNWPRLTKLEISSPMLINADLLEIANMTSLQHVDLRRCRAITDEGVAALTRLPNLQSLVLNRCTQLTDATVANLADSSLCDTLEYLNFNRCRWLTDRSCSSLKKFVRLRRVDLRHCSLLTDTGISDLAVLTSLESLNINSCPLLTKVSYDLLVDLVQLKYLDIRKCSFAMLMNLPIPSPNLTIKSVSLRFR